MTDALINHCLHQERLRKSLTTITLLIEKGNEELWPIFEVLEGELVKQEQRQNKLLKYSFD